MLVACPFPETRVVERGGDEVRRDLEMSPLSSRRAARRTATISVLLGVLVVVAAAVTASTVPGPSRPVLTVMPANPTGSRDASFAYTDTTSVSFLCSLDDSAFVACGSGLSGSKAYPAQAEGWHRFKVKAVSQSTSSATSHTWLIDSSLPSHR